MYVKAYLQTQHFFLWHNGKIIRKGKKWPSRSLVHPWEQFPNTSKVVAKRQQSLTSIQQNMSGQNWESLQTWFSYSSSAKIPATYCEQLVEGYLKHLTQVKKYKISKYVNFWPTGDGMKEIKAEINNSLDYYSDISHS